MSLVDGLEAEAPRLVPQLVDPLRDEPLTPVFVLPPGDGVEAGLRADDRFLLDVGVAVGETVAGDVAVAVGARVGVAEAQGLTDAWAVFVASAFAIAVRSALAVAALWFSRHLASALLIGGVT